MEKIEDLGIKGCKIIQDKDGFCFGSDAILLSRFIRLRPRSRVLDLCTGTGIIAVLTYALWEPSAIDAVEILPRVADTARRTMLLNGLEDKIRVANADLKNAPELYGKGVFDAVTCNPPYMKGGGGIVNPKDELAVSRHEILCTLDDVVSVSADCLKPCGRLFMVHRADRLCDVISTMRKHKIEPKRLAVVYPDSRKGAILVLVEGLKGGNPQLTIEKPVFMYDDDGNYIQSIVQ